jgi:hypothetical protein
MFSAEAAVMVSGNAMANIYLTGKRGWSEPPDLEAAGGRPAELIARLLEEPAIDQVIFKRARHSYVVASSRGRAVIDVATAPERESTVTYTAQGDDPLGLGPLPAGMTRAEIAARTAASDYPDAPWQIIEFFRSPRAGDLIVCARPGYDLRDNFEYQPHLGSHGGLHREHMMVPAAVTGAWTQDHLRSVDLFPSILLALGKPVPTGAIDGQAIAIRPV